MKIKFVKANRALNVSTSAMFLALGVLFPLSPFNMTFIMQL